MMMMVMKMERLEWQHSTDNSKVTVGTVDRWDTRPLIAHKEEMMETTGSKGTTTTTEVEEASEDAKVEDTMEDRTAMEEAEAAELPNSKANATTVEGLATGHLNAGKKEEVKLTLPMLH